MYFYIDAPPPVTYTLSLHDALPISPPTPGSNTVSANRAAWAELTFTYPCGIGAAAFGLFAAFRGTSTAARGLDRKSTRLNSSHVENSYAVISLKKKTYTDSTIP